MDLFHSLINFSLYKHLISHIHHYFFSHSQVHTVTPMLTLTSLLCSFVMMESTPYVETNIITGLNEQIPSTPYNNTAHKGTTPFHTHSKTSLSTVRIDTHRLTDVADQCTGEAPLVLSFCTSCSVPDPGVTFVSGSLQLVFPSTLLASKPGTPPSPSPDPEPVSPCQAAWSSSSVGAAPAAPLAPPAPLPSGS